MVSLTSRSLVLRHFPGSHLPSAGPILLAWPLQRRTHPPPGALGSPAPAWWPPVPRLRQGATPLSLPASSLRSSRQIYYWEADSQNDTEKMRVLFLPETTAKLKNLTSHTKYLVSISAFNAAGDGPRSEPQPGCTHQAGRSTQASHRLPRPPPAPSLPLPRCCPPPPLQFPQLPTLLVLKPSPV